jgi:hypothetical protein
MGIPKHPAADAHDHWAVSVQKGLEGGFILPADKAFQQLPVGETRPIPNKHSLAQTLENRVDGSG